MACHELTDLSKDRAVLRALYAPGAGAFATVDVPTLPFAIVDGQGSPDQDAVQRAIKAIYTSVYPIRREARERAGKDFVEPPVEIAYWADDMSDLKAGRRERWKWQVQITLPVWADAQRLEESVSEMRGQLDTDLIPRWQALNEGLCVQYLHVGEIGELGAILERLYTEFLPQEGVVPAGAYHEIYLDDFKRVAPSRRKMIVRQPVRAAA